MIIGEQPPINPEPEVNTEEVFAGWVNDSRLQKSRDFAALLGVDPTTTNDNQED